MATDLSLLFRLKADNAQLKGTIADTKQAVAQLRQSFGPQLTQTVTVANNVFNNLDGSLQNFVAQRVPLVGGAIVSITNRLRGFGSESAKADKASVSLARSIQGIATQSGKSVPQVAAFLTKFVQLEGQAKRDSSAVEFFGAALGAKMIPQLEKAGTALAAVSTESAAASAGFASMAGPIGIAVVAVAALVGGVALIIREMVQLTVRTAGFQGKLHDLSQEVNVSVSSLSAFEVLARRTGGELGTITQAVVLFQRKLDDAQNPLSKTAELFRKFNIETSDTETSLRSAFNALAAMPEGFAQTNAAAELFGARGGKQVLAILKETNGDIDGTISRLRDIGILISADTARAADKLNDELTMLEFQFRALTAAAGEDFIPVLTDIVRSLGLMLRAAQPVISIMASLTAKAIFPVTKAFKGLSIIVATLTGDYKALAEAMKEVNDIPPIEVPEIQKPTTEKKTSEQSASEAVNTADAVLAAVKRKAAETNQALDELFQKGRRDRAQQAEEIIAANKEVLEAEKQGIDARLAQKEQEIKALDEAQAKRGEIVRRDTEDYRAITAEIGKLQQERLDKESEFDVTSRAIRAKVAKENADARRNQIANDTDIIVSEIDRQIKKTEAALQGGVGVEKDNLALIEQLEQAKIDARIESIGKQGEIGFLTVQNQKDLDQQLIQLGQERDRLLDEQQARRLQRERNAAERQRDILLTSIDTLLQIQQTRGQRIIDAQTALAEARVITEEQAAKKILEINLDLIDSQIEAAKAKLTAAKSIVDVSERVRTEADLNNQIKILTEERVSIEADGARETDEGRQRDLDNFQQYADELQDLTEQVTRIQREAAEEAIRLLRINFASRLDLVRARTKLDVDEENERHRQAGQRLRDLEKENRESKRSALDKLNIEFEINRLREAEAERHRLAMQGIRDQGKKDEQAAGPFGDFRLGTDDLKEFASSIEETVIPLGNILKRTFLEVADALGAVVANYVLLGETGPAVMRKILAQALASIAAEAAVNAIKMAAVGFARLAFGDFAGAANAFVSAGLWGAIAGGSAIAGRGVAGDLFKQKSASSGGSGGGGSASGSRNERDPIDLTRPQVQVLEIRLHGEPGPGFRNAIFTSVVDDVRSNGPMRTVIKEVTEG